MIQADWDNPFSQWIVAVSDATLRNRWWGDVADRSDRLIEWFAQPDHECPAAIAPLDALSGAIADPAGLTSPEQSVADFLSGLGLTPLSEPQLRAILTAYLLRDDQSDAQISESVEIMRTMSPEDRASFERLYESMEYYADLLSEDHEDQEVIDLVRQVFVTRRPEIERLFEEVIMPALLTTPWLTESLAQGRFCTGCAG